VPTTLLTARTEVRSIIDEPIEQYWSDAELNSWINQACEETQRNAEWARKQGTLAATAAVQAYVAPTDLVRIYRLEFVPTNQTAYTYSLDFRGYNEMDAAWGNLKTLPSAYPQLYTLWNNPDDSDPTVKGLQILLYPVPQVAGTLNVYYYRSIIPAVNDTDDIDILVGWETMIYDWAAGRALRKDADPRFREYQADWTQKLQDLTARSRLYTDQANWFSTGQQNYNPLFLDLEE
jgi:hypothetical protein